MKDFYKTLVISEAGHYTVFVKLAKLYFDSDKVNNRLEELSLFESEIVKALPN